MAEDLKKAPAHKRYLEKLPTAQLEKLLMMIQDRMTGMKKEDIIKKVAKTLAEKRCIKKILSASIWLRPWEALYKYLYTIQCNGYDTLMNSIFMDSENEDEVDLTVC